MNAPETLRFTPDEVLQGKCDHEAGHYVALLATGLRHTLDYISVEKSKSAGGSICYSPLETPTLEQYAIIAMGGLAAAIEGEFRRRGIDEYHPDANIIILCCEEASGDDFDLLVKTYSQPKEDFYPYLARATDIIRERWNLVEAISSELKSHRRLSCDEVKLIVDHFNRSA